MLYSILKTAHILSIIVWLGGMTFSVFFLKPALAQLDPALRAKFMHDILGRFFKAVLWASLVAVGSGLWMMGRVAKAAVQSGAGWSMPTSWMVMAVLGTLMLLIFGHIRFVLYKRLGSAVAAGSTSAAGDALAAIRSWVAVNLAIGVVVVLVALLRL
ncbi:MAG: hypothetical protein EAZ30_07680 [Betaproteobacteria bacterium]|nr:MAG: hypothetical protein EAZ30_07680 [Betaproteobacteria bacterium]